MTGCCFLSFFLFCLHIFYSFVYHSIHVCVCVNPIDFSTDECFQWVQTVEKKQSKKKKDPSLISLISGFIFFRFRCRCCCCHTWHKLSWIIGWMNGHRANFSLYLKDKDLLGNETFFFSFLLFFFFFRNLNREDNEWICWMGKPSPTPPPPPPNTKKIMG